MGTKAEKNITKQHDNKDILIAASITASLLMLIGSFISAKLAAIFSVLLAMAFSITFIVQKYPPHSVKKQSQTTVKQKKKQYKKPSYASRIQAQRADAIYMTPKRLNAANDATPGSFQSLKDRAIQQAVRRAVKNNKIHMFSQPIVEISSRQTRFQEVFSRIQFRDDAYVPASRYLNLAKKDGMIANIDYASVSHAVKAVKNAIKTKNHQGLFFINISCHTLKNGRFMGQLLSEIAQNRSIAPFIVFEIQQDDFDMLDQQTFDVLEGLSALGCRLSIDNVYHLNFDIENMRDLNVRFMKLDAQMLLQMAKTDKGATDIQMIKRELNKNDIKVVVEKVENEFDLKEIAGFGFQYAQGYLFSKPTLKEKAA